MITPEEALELVLQTAAPRVPQPLCLHAARGLVLAEDIDSDSPWRITPLPTASSADVFRTCGANCYIEVPPLHRMLSIGELRPFTWLGSESWTK